MYRIQIYDRFASAHFLKGYKGKCESLHGHNWKVDLEVLGSKLDDVGMLIDFRILKEMLAEVLKDLDHCLLNELDAFSRLNPSSEIIAKYIYDSIKKKLPSGVSINKVRVWESENSAASYFE